MSQIALDTADDQLAFLVAHPLQKWRGDMFVSQILRANSVVMDIHSAPPDVEMVGLQKKH